MCICLFVVDCFLLFRGFYFFYRKLTLKEALDVLDDNGESENSPFPKNVHALYIQPPDNDDELSGEDDAFDNEGGIPDHVCASQLKAGCELVFEDGHRIDYAADDEGGIEITHINDEEVLASIMNAQVVFADDDESFTSTEQPSTSKSPPRKRLCRVQATPSPLTLPKANANTKFVWEKDTTSSPIPIFPDANCEDCRNLKAHEQFEKFFDDVLLQHIIHCSTVYATFHHRPDPKITIEGKKKIKIISVFVLASNILFSSLELRTFIGILLVSGYTGVNSHRNLWSSENDLRNEMVFNAMRRNRFEEILRNLHFEPNVRAPNDNTDKLWKLRPILDHIKAKTLENFHPEQNLSFDESMIAYFGRHGCKQFIKGKPLRFGYKVWSLCTPEGYLINFDIYQGKNPRSINKYDERFGKCAAPLINMLDDFSAQVSELPFSFFFDNLFTGFPLLAYLSQRGYNGSGTIRENRIPSSCPIPTKAKLIQAKKPRGHIESSKMKGTNIRLVKWIDNSVVCAASSCFGVQPISSASRYSKAAHKKISVSRPCVITEYNKYMGGVDRFDQSTSLYRIGWRGKKWWSSIFTWLIDASIVNAWILQRKHKPGTKQFDFRREIAMYYCKHFGELPRGPGKFSVEKHRYDKDTLLTTLRFDRTDHLVVPLDKKRRCAGEACKSIVRSSCRKCDVGLCIPCFEQYHKKPQ